MIVKNEEDWIAAAVSSVISLVSEVIIVDTGSTDRTLERVQPFDPVVIHSEWRDHFGDTRNVSLAKARYPWILVLDADECIAQADLGRLETATSGPWDGYHLIQRNYVNQNHVHGWQPNTSDYEEGRPYPGFVDNPLIRFFRNDPGLRFRGAVHEIVDPATLSRDLRFSSLNVVIHHFGKVRGDDRVRAKQRFYLKLGERKLAENPGDAKALTEYGIQLQELGREAESRGPFMKAFQMSGNPVNLLYAAIADKKAGDLTGSVRLLNRAAAAGLDSFELHLECGNVRLALGEYAQALESYRTALLRSPGNPVATFNIGLTYRKSGDDEQAESYYRRTLHLDPAFVEPGLELASVCSDTGRFPDAASILEGLLVSHPDHRELSLALAKAYIQLKRPGEALALLKSRFPEDSVADALRGAAHLECGDRDRAREHLERAIRADPSIVDARINISHIYAGDGEFPRAARHLRFGYERTQNADLLPALSIYEARGGLLDDALLHLNEVFRLGRATAEHWICRHLILERRQERELAAAHLDQMWALVPEMREWIALKRAEAEASSRPGAAQSLFELARPAEGVVGES